MIELLSNQWVVGICGGIISGIIVYIVTYYLSTRKEDKIRMQKAEVANNELLHIMRPLIIDKTRFNTNLFDSITASLANKHGVDEDDLLDLIDMGNEIIRDIMQSPFLNIEIKDKYCSNILEEVKKEEELREREFNDYVSSKKNVQAKSSESSKFISLLLALTTSLFTALSSTILFSNNKEVKLDILQSVPIAVPLVALIVIPISALLVVQLLQILKRNLQVREEIRSIKNEEK
ncbi:hypothetical protein EHQ81_18850 [Leptospira selangorensis]|uniref:Uncharacterized protein n=1 Tax=Leptospira selangorensis TaxID=2484982 RepID=A0A5F2BWQ3_9LEPT|nr:hypothetical protein [Leptospira selangorensis]TGM10687.1 hypothetical protein EHQ81_18850 [Leptospira selangorensis]TGM11018.1 hypothetical protein EHQ82_21370 [Leptospira selangorensis]